MNDATLSVGVFNIDRFGWDKAKGHHRLPAPGLSVEVTGYHVVAHPARDVSDHAYVFGTYRLGAA